MIRALTFDLDGTLYNARRIRVRFALANLFRLRPLRIAMRAREKLRSEAFADRDAYFSAETAAIAAALGWDPERARQTVDDLLGPRLERTLKSAGPWPDAVDALSAAAGRVKIAVISDYAVESKLNALGLSELPWSAHIAADLSGALKPHPRAFEKCLKALEVGADECVHIGDRADTDEEGARAAGMSCVILGRDADTLSACIELALSR